MADDRRAIEHLVDYWTPLLVRMCVEAGTWIEPVAGQLDDMLAMGALYRFDRFKAPAALWDELQERFPELLDAG